MLGAFFSGQSEYIEGIVPLIAITTIVFTFSIFAGYALGDQTSAQSFEGVLSNIPDPTEASGIEMFLAIFYNNVVASFLFVLTGIFVGIPPLMFMAFNGFFIGYISWSAAQTQGILFVLATILPHGIIEIPSILLSAAMGMGLGFKLIHKLMRREGLRKYVSQTFTVFVFRVVPLLVFAAGIETALIYIYVL